MIALGVMVLSPRTPAGEGAWPWAQRLALTGLAGLIAPFSDADRLARRRRLSGRRILRLVPLLAVPLLGGALFLGLFAIANPVISQVLAAWSWPQLDIPRGLFWLVCFVCAWMALAPRAVTPPALRLFASAGPDRAGLGVTTVCLSLAMFNLVFAVQNGLDIAFLWSGAPLPAGVSVSDYVHRGAFTLIVAALLAGAFVLVALAPGSATARSPLLRKMVLLWMGQTLVLVASSVLRTLDYVEAFSLTGLRLAALIWMGLVAIGLGLICWRMLAGKSAAWLINANAAAAALVLVGCGLVDLNATASAWNIDHAGDVGGAGAPIDLCYLVRMGPSATVSLSRLAARRLPPALHDRVAWARAQSLANLTMDQSQWRGWTWRGQRRLTSALAILPPADARAGFAPGARDCDGAPLATSSSN